MNDCRYSGGLRINRSSRQTTCQSTQEMELATRCYQQNVINVSCVKLKLLIDFESTLTNKNFSSILRISHNSINNVS